MTVKPQRPNIRPARPPGPKPQQASPRPEQAVSRTGHPEPLQASYEDLLRYRSAAEKKLLAFKDLVEGVGRILDKGRVEEAQKVLKAFDCEAPKLEGLPGNG